MSRHKYQITFDIEVSPDVEEGNVVEGAYAVQNALENHIAALADGPDVPDVDVWNISVERKR